jgi:hypothetical protein
MAFLHLKLEQLLEDLDSEGKPRIRAKVSEIKPRTINMNLKNATADQINQLKKLVGGTAMIGVREGMMNGQTFFQFLTDEEIIPIQEPNPVSTSKTVDINPVDEKKPLFNTK